MAKRHFKRFPVGLNARIVSGGKSYEGIIGNISEEGLAYSLSTFIQAAADFTPQKTIEIIFKIPSGETVNLRCEIMWFLRPSQGKNTLILGMKIMEPPPKYMEWIKNVESSQR